MASNYLMKYPVPEGFPEIMNDFALAVLED